MSPPVFGIRKGLGSARTGDRKGRPYGARSNVRPSYHSPLRGVEEAEGFFGGGCTTKPIRLPKSNQHAVLHQQSCGAFGDWLHLGGWSVVFRSDVGGDLGDGVLAV